MLHLEILNGVNIDIDMEDQLDQILEASHIFS